MGGRLSLLTVLLVACSGVAACSGAGDDAAPPAPEIQESRPTTTSTTIPPSVPTNAPSRDPFQPQG